VGTKGAETMKQGVIIKEGENIEEGISSIIRETIEQRIGK
jgi:hypothetical protein